MPSTPKEEDYCRRFLLLFYNYRSEEDLKLSGSYKRRLLPCHENNELQEYLHVAQNIQNIRNSLDSGTINDCVPPENEFQDETLPDADDDEDEELHDLVAAFFHSTTTEKEGKKHTEPVEFVFPEPSLKNDNARQGLAEEPSSVFQFRPEKEAKSNNNPGHFHRYRANVYGLNSLVQEQFIMRNAQGKTSVKPIGTVESIITFGITKGLDLDQQTAFEILAADIVLSFVSESVNTLPPDRREREIPHLLQEQKMLQDLAQISLREGKPLRMFLTGPAGAGKCKLVSHNVSDAISCATSSLTNVLGHSHLPSASQHTEFPN